MAQRFAEIHRTTVDPPTSTMRFNGQPALGLGIVMADGGNILALGQAMAARVATIKATLPLGVQIAALNDQSEVVATDVADFQRAFLESLAIVLLVSFTSLGWRAGLVVAVSVPLVLAGVFVGMAMLGDRPAAHLAGGDVYRARLAGRSRHHRGRDDER